MIRNPSEVILILVPSGRDGALAAAVSARAGIPAKNCTDLRELCSCLREAGDSVAAILLAEEASASPGEMAELTTWLQQQPPWSDLPIILLTMAGGTTYETSEHLLALFDPVGVVTVLERPMRQSTLLTALQVALRARRRQYQVRDLLARERENTAALGAAKAEAEAANRAKDQFLAVLSHELRTPLNAILGWTQLLNADPDDVETRQSALDVIERNTKVQAQLIEDLLDVSRITSGKLRLDVRPINPHETIHAALETVMPAAEARGIALRYTPETRPCLVNADPDRLQQVVWNLLSNAIKFTPHGGQVHVQAQREDACFELIVTDTGQGIAPEFVPAVFERFSQADTTSTRVHKGLGLGLAICRHLVEQHGGVIFVNSPGIGQGSTFTIRLPLLDGTISSIVDGGKLIIGTRALTTSGSSADGTSLGKPAGELAGIRILVVDDDTDARMLLNQLLGRQGAEVLLASNAAEAFQVVERMAPDVLLCDVEMPGEDGYSLIRRVRSLPPASGGTVPAAAVTAYARPEDRERALAAGFQQHVPKPIDPAQIVALAANMARRNGAFAAATTE